MATRYAKTSSKTLNMIARNVFESKKLFFLLIKLEVFAFFFEHESFFLIKSSNFPFLHDLIFDKLIGLRQK